MTDEEKRAINRRLLEFAGLRDVESGGLHHICEGDESRQDYFYSSAEEAFSHFDLFGEKRHSAYWREQVMLELMRNQGRFYLRIIRGKVRIMLYYNDTGGDHIRTRRGIRVVGKQRVNRVVKAIRAKKESE